ncbi:hypothetical protein [Pedobacter cryoconitis]|uniref:Collagen triple helix repeat protein n=1 Tax=Pedobacter cryoconitis TaxID=188932 RepID=A0A327SS59_9SPHI|nr:hypothetical protein [Pedobacter cryoconitis]RAJ32130.1 hypothetical protein LY11_01811 [Pedobacter cryoconitis]
MKLFITVVISLIWCLPAIAQPPLSNTKTGPQKYLLEYDPNVLRIEGNSLPIGIVALSDQGQKSQTKGFLNGLDNWSKYKVEIDSGSYSNGKIKIKGSGKVYKKGDSLTVNVYTKKSFLGGKDKWLFMQKIPYNYETSINILTAGNFSKAPGDHVQFGVRKHFDNKMFIDKWAPVKKNLKDFVFLFNGVHISKSKGDLKIDNDPTKIKNNKIQLITLLARNTAITDTLNVLLDYVANYQFNTRSSGTGYDLNVTADIYHDPVINAQLLKIRIQNQTTHQIYNYWVNTDGGSIAISSKSANGSDGFNGSDGAGGTSGSPGTVSTNTETKINADGTTTTTTNTVTGPGGNGQDGQHGGDGRDGDAGGNGGNIIIHYSPGVTPYLNLIQASSIPGRGGSGGRAGKGGTGGSGGVGNPNGNSGSNGRDGRNGSDGYNGRKGNVIFKMTDPIR